MLFRRYLVLVLLLIGFGEALSQRSSTTGAIAENQWSVIGSLGIARTNIGAVYIGNGRILVMGGSTGIPQINDPMSIPQAACDIVDVWQRRVIRASSMSIARSEFVALQTHDSNVIVVGGVTGIDPQGDVTASVERFDRASGLWTTIGSLGTARRQHGAAFIDSHRILVVGGRARNYATLTDAEIFDVRTGTSKRAAAFPYPINGSILMTSHSGELVVVGGRSGGINSERRADVYAYNAERNDWVLNRVLGQSVTGVSGLRLWDRRAIVAGGIHAEVPARTATEVQLENVGKWKLISPMTGGRTNAALAQWNENRVLVIGGHQDNGVPVATTEWIDMNRHTSTPGPTLAVPRDRFTAMSIHSAASAEPHMHTVVAIGGLQTQTSLTGVIEILEP